MIDIKEVSLLWFITVLIINAPGNGVKSMPNQQLTDDLYKPIITKFKIIKLYSSFRDKMWGADLADMQLISKFNKRIRFLLCVFEVFGKYAWVVTLRDKKDVTINNTFQKNLDDSVKLS